MDKRQYKRTDVTLVVKISYPDTEPQLVKSRDFSDGGMFLIIEDASRPIIGEVVSVELIEPADGIDILPSHEAVVVRQEKEGIGLSFIEMDFGI